MTASDTIARSGALLRPPVQPSDHTSGRDDAPATLVEYGDFQCPYSFRAHPIVRALQQRLGNSLRFVFRNCPLSELHPHALAAAEAAESVAEHAGEDAYWKMHDALFTHQQNSGDALDRSHLLQYAEEAGANRNLVEYDLDRHVHVGRLRADFVSGVRSGANGTPAFFINGERWDGDWTQLHGFEMALRAAATTPVP